MFQLHMADFMCQDPGKGVFVLAATQKPRDTMIRPPGAAKALISSL